MPQSLPTRPARVTGLARFHINKSAVDPTVILSPSFINCLRSDDILQQSSVCKKSNVLDSDSYDEISSLKFILIS